MARGQARGGYEGRVRTQVEGAGHGRGQAEREEPGQ